MILAHNCPAFNKASIRLRQRENGFSGTNYFRQIAQGQVFANGAWRNRRQPGHPAVARSSRTTGRTSSTTGRTGCSRWNNEFNFSHRILVRLQWWNNSGTPGFFGDDFTVANGGCLQPLHLSTASRGAHGGGAQLRLRSPSSFLAPR